MLMTKAKTWLLNEDGAVTVDWVVLCAAVIGMGMVVLQPIAFSTTSSTAELSIYVESLPVGYGNN